MNRRDFIGAIGASSALMAIPAWGVAGNLIVPRAKGLRITGTFLDEISHDIPHQNWGLKEWDADFAYMRTIGIDTVIMIRCGHRKFITYPSQTLLAKGCYRPSVDLVDMFLALAEKHGMSFYFGLYDPGTGYMKYAEANMPIIEEVWKTYGHRKAFKGWYVSAEFSHNRDNCIEATHMMGRQCKDVSDSKMPTLISPWIDGKKAVMDNPSIMAKKEGVSISQHEKEWTEIFDGVKDVIDVCAFQDGHVDYNELDAFLDVNARLCRKAGIRCWSNVESFDRDMPIRFLPIKFDKMRMKLESAARVGLEKGITFEFSHFMSPQSMYKSAGGLYNRYREYFGI